MTRRDGLNGTWDGGSDGMERDYGDGWYGYARKHHDGRCSGWAWEVSRGGEMMDCGERFSRSDACRNADEVCYRLRVEWEAMHGDPGQSL